MPTQAMATWIEDGGPMKMVQLMVLLVMLLCHIVAILFHILASRGRSKTLKNEWH